MKIKRKKFLFVPFCPKILLLSPVRRPKLLLESKKILKELIKELLLIKPTSVDSERAFSICAMIDTFYQARILPEKILQNSLYQSNFVYS